MHLTYQELVSVGLEIQNANASHGGWQAHREEKRSRNQDKLRAPASRNYDDSIVWTSLAPKSKPLEIFRPTILRHVVPPRQINAPYPRSQVVPSRNFNAPHPRNQAEPPRRVIALPIPPHQEWIPRRRSNPKPGTLPGPKPASDPKPVMLPIQGSTPKESLSSTSPVRRRNPNTLENLVGATTNEPDYKFLQADGYMDEEDAKLSSDHLLRP